jgi:hypothetical protein
MGRYKGRMNKKGEGKGTEGIWESRDMHRKDTMGALCNKDTEKRTEDRHKREIPIS